MAIQVLIVDDEPYIRDMLKIFLEKNQFIVTIESSVANAGKLVYNENFDIVISDMMMPDGTGIDLLKISKEKNFFPGYILIEINGKISPSTVTKLREINGVIGFLGTEKGKNPIPLRKSEINKLLGKVDELAEKDESIHIPYLVGESVKIIDGPFNSFIGIIEEVNEERKKLKVMVKIFGRKTPVELNYLQVEKVQN